MHVHLAASEGERMPTFANAADLIEQALHDIHAGGTELTNQHLFDVSVQVLTAAVRNGFGAPAYGQPNYPFARQLQHNAAVFAAFKNHQQTAELVALMKDERGGLRSWADFKRGAQPIIGQYNEQWLNTEYVTALRSARMADVWKRAEANADIFPNLKYMPSKAATPRELHRKLWGTIRPIRDPFWDTWMPPSAWKCQCWVQPTDEAPTPVPDVLPRIDPALANNPGKTGKLFTDKNPYQRRVSKKKQGTILQDLQQNLLPNSSVLYERAYTPAKGKGFVDVHFTHHADELAENLTYAKRLADEGQAVQLLSYAEHRKNPDATLARRIADFKRPDQPTNMAGSIQNKVKLAGSQKAEICVIDLDVPGVAFQDVVKGLLAATQEGYNKSIAEVWLLLPGRASVRLTRGEIRDGSFTAKIPPL